MGNAIYRLERPKNEPVLGYAPGSPERAEIRARLAELRGQEPLDIPLIIGGEEVRTGDLGECRIPHDHGHVLARYHKAGTKEVDAAIEAAMAAKPSWAAANWQDRLAVFLKAADLLAGPYRSTVNAATMLNQSKTVFQAEIDAACELIDFYRFNAHFATQIYQDQPDSAPQQWNQLEYRPLDGFVFAASPFNFASIAGNLPGAPAMLGNTVLWKPSGQTVYSCYYLMKLLTEAGLPGGVINFIPGESGGIADRILESADFAGLHYTGSTRVFSGLWKKIGEKIRSYRSYPRMVGETGGKDFVFVHNSADIRAVAVALVRGAFEYQGQKCSAVSRAYVPSSIWPELKDLLLEMTGEIATGPAEDFSNFCTAVIGRRQFDKIREYIDAAKESQDAEILVGGGCDDAIGYFVEPTVIVAAKADYRTMVEEVFGPVLTIYVYDDDTLAETLALCDRTSPYALTGAIFARDRMVIAEMRAALAGAAGNFYINDKPTGAVVGQQPFGGGRASGTNDKAGSILNLYRWLNPRTIKENFVPPTEYAYPFMTGDGEA